MSRLTMDRKVVSLHILGVVEFSTATFLQINCWVLIGQQSASNRQECGLLLARALVVVDSAVFTSIAALGTSSRTGPLARKYLPSFPYIWSLRRLRQKISSIYCILYATIPAQHKLTGYALLVFVRSCSSINKKIISLKNYFTTASWGPSKRKKNQGALGTCPVCPLDKTALVVDLAPCRRPADLICR